MKNGMSFIYRMCVGGKESAIRRHLKFVMVLQKKYGAGILVRLHSANSLNRSATNMWYSIIIY